MMVIKVISWLRAFFFFFPFSTQNKSIEERYNGVETWYFSIGSFILFHVDKPKTERSLTDNWSESKLLENVPTDESFA